MSIHFQFKLNESNLNLVLSTQLALYLRPTSEAGMSQINIVRKHLR